ncbi:MAG: DUF4215 domain-containing protein [Nannocystaceae bacterium]
MRTRTWLSTFATCSALALSACADDVVPPLDTDGTETGATGSGSTDAPMTTAVDTTAADTTAGSTDTDPDGICGDGMVTDGEACDDANAADGDGCSATCEIEDGFGCDDAEPSVCAGVCGDGTVVDGETCDDGNEDDGDGCDAMCEVEDGFDCDDAEPTVCAGVCGDGIVVGTEECDDANTELDDGCDAACVVEPGWACGEEPSLCMTGCGDGIVAGMELCDDGNPDGGDGCSARCTIEMGWLCMDEPSLCDEDCGDGLVVGAETCDDGGLGTGDGCDDTCGTESGWYCEGEPSVCDTQCGDGLVAGAEVCDDDNLAQGDGCGPTCEVEFPFACDMAEPSGCVVNEVLDQMALGFEGGCILTVSGQVACFGNNSQGQTGNGTIDVETFLPVPVLDMAESITAGDQHHCAVRTGGEVWCWGENLDDQMGPASIPNVDEDTPLQITGLPVITQMDAGDDHNCAIDIAGAVWCWGDNDNRQLGRGGTSTTDDPNPAVVPLGPGIVATDLGLGENHSCAVLASGAVACWGDDDSGQLGDGASGTDSGTATIVPGLVDVVEVEGGRDTTCAIDGPGGVWCWGNNNVGQVGNGATVDIATPQAVPLPAPAEAISLGSNFSCALLTTDQVWCWGEGNDYQLGYGDLIHQSSPVEVLDLPAADLVDIEAGDRGVCVSTSTGERWCWGYSEEGQLGMAPLNQLDLGAPLPFSGPLSSVELATPEYRGITCGVLTDGTVECAGDGTVVSTSTTTGAAGLFTSAITSHLSTLTAIPGLVDVQGLSLGDSFACARTSANVLCWGDNSNLQLGQGGPSTIDIADPVPVVSLGFVDEIDAGDQFACARIGGSIVCWGDNDNRQTGEDTTTADQSSPVAVPLINDAVDIECGENHACALRAGGVVSCWGDDGAGQLGDDDGDTIDSATPVDVVGLPGPADELVVGQDHACARVGTDVYCWGDATRGQLGQGNTLDSDLALLVPGLGNVVEIATGFNYTCARDDMDEVMCWGYGLDGQLGNGGEELNGIPDFSSPVPFSVASGITGMALGNGHSCMQTAAGWQCLGFRSSGQLADGTSVEPSLPTPMFFGI